MALLLSLLLACQGETESVPLDTGIEDPCTASIASYENVGAPFMLTWCSSCHSSYLAEEERQHAPVSVNLETYDDILLHAGRIYARSAGENATMPPAGGPSQEERDLLAEWLDCGAP